MLYWKLNPFHLVEMNGCFRACFSLQVKYLSQDSGVRGKDTVKLFSEWHPRLELLSTWYRVRQRLAFLCIGPPPQNLKQSQLGPQYSQHATRMVEPPIHERGLGRREVPSLGHRYPRQPQQQVAGNLMRKADALLLPGRKLSGSTIDRETYFLSYISLEWYLCLTEVRAGKGAIFDHIPHFCLS